MTTPDPVIAALTLQVAELREVQAAMLLRLGSLEDHDSKKYRPRDAPKWHDITSESKELEVARLRGWERDVLVPVLGHHLAHCWPLHLPAVARMDVACELWMVLWLSRRTPAMLSAQAEYLVRYLPGLADDIRAACRDCDHGKPQAVAS